MSDIKYALYTSSKGFKVVGGTAAHFLKGDGSIDSTSYIPLSQKNAAGGVPSLDSTGQISNVQIPDRLFSKIIAIGGEAADKSFTGLYDRNQLALADKEHDVNFVINGSGIINGTQENFKSEIFNQKPSFAYLKNCDSTTELVVTITLNYILTNYGRGLWQPFVQTRLNTERYFRNITVEVMDNNNVWYSPANFIATNITNVLNSGLYLFPESLVGTASVRGVRFKLSNPITTDGVVYLTQIGFRHVSHTFAPQFPHRGDDNTFFGINNFTKSPIVPVATQSDQAVNFGQLSNYYTQNEASALFVRKNGAETISDTKTFTHSPVIPNATQGIHAVNKNQIELSATQEGEGGQQLNISGNNSVSLTNFYVTSQDGTRNADDIAPNSTSRRVRFDFVKSNSAKLKAAGNYAGIMTYSPWDGTTGSTGDSSYQLAFANQTGINGDGLPMLKIRKGIDGNWTTPWYKLWTEGDFTSSNIQQWNYAYQYGLKLNQEFTTNLNTGLLIADNYFGGESGIIDNQQKKFLAAKRGEYYFYGSELDLFDGLNYHVDMRTFGMGREANGTDKLTVEGSVKASKNFKSEDERADTVFIPNGNVSNLRDEIINDESEYAIRLDPHEYVMDSYSDLVVDDRNRLIHIIGEYTKMFVDFKNIYPKQQIVIYNFDQNDGLMEVKIQGKPIYYIESRCFIRLYVTRSLRVIVERLQPCEIVW
ncbi:hypothetical protein [Flavobacterium sp. B17]|uniref:hypothetical protein n=1 Tax=Flavobacterium sp. B17 TaxID=95618 RepID=UPI0003473EA0|nr:hypothetical protein [Flavobacterium sp. B17]